ncbi:hypothetical protein V8C40DRAFT_251507 [Trichoderma camerunense]
MLVWVLIGVFSFFMFEWAVSETSMLVLLVVGGDDEGTRLWFPWGGERANTVSYQFDGCNDARTRDLQSVGRGETRRRGTDSIRFGSVGRKGDAMLYYL